VQAGIDKDLATMATIQIAGEQYTLASLKAVFSADSAAMDATDQARKALQLAVQTEKAVHARTMVVLSALRSFLLGYFGKLAVTVLGDFGMNAPKSKATKTVATKAVAVAKAKATRAARGTKGPVAKLDVVGTVDGAAIKASIETPNATPSTPSAPAAAPPPAPAATSATPAPATAPAAPKAGS
jgi:hypothetical protein